MNVPQSTETDIVARLREEYVTQSARCGEEDSQDRSLLAQEAADEIERLRTIVRSVNRVISQNESHKWKVERIVAALGETS